MGVYEFLDYLRQVVLLRELQAVVNVLDYVRCALQRGQARMIFLRRFAGKDGLVLNEAERVEQFADIVIQGSGPYKGHIGTDGPGGVVRHIHHVEAMLEGAGRFALKQAQKLVVSIGQLLQPGLGHKVEDALEQVGERITRH